MKYGIDIKVPTTDPKWDGWCPVTIRGSKDTRMTFETSEAMLTYLDQLIAANRTLETRVVQIDEHSAYQL